MSFFDDLFGQETRRMKMLTAYSEGQLQWAKQMKEKYPTFPLVPPAFIPELWAKNVDKSE